MSMLSAQIDELRNTAEFYDGFKAANLMREAADTIWQLRDDLQRAKRLGGELEFQIKDNWKLTTELAVSQAENAKLRELVADMWFWQYEGHIDSESQERQMLHIDAVIQRMRELGVEV